MTRRAADYLHNAKECRRLALVIGQEAHRKALLDMATAWEDLAQEQMTPDQRPRLVRSMDET